MERKLDLDPWGILLLSIMMLLLPLNWLLSAIAAALFHEFCHFAAVNLCGGKILSIKVGPSGIIMHASPMDKSREAFCAAAGPVGSIFLLCFARWIPCISICAAVQGIFNLLPVYPLDGGRLLRHIASDSVCGSIKNVVLVVIFLAAIMACVWLQVGVFPLIIALFLCFRSMEIKIPCKQVNKRVQ